LPSKPARPSKMDDWSERWLARVTFRPATPDEDRVRFITDPMSGKLSLSHRTFCALTHRRTGLLSCFRQFFPPAAVTRFRLGELGDPDW
jgi:hypothetical protein